MAAPPAPPFGPPPVAVGSAATASDDLAPQHLVGPAVTLVLGWIVGLAMYFSASDAPSGYLGDRVVPFAMILVAVAVPVALLFAWGEVDLSAFGMLPFGAWIYTEVGDSGAVVGLVVVGLACGAIGLCIGLVRWATRAPSAVVTLAAGFALQMWAFKQIGVEGPRVIEDGVIEGSSLPVVVGLVFTALTVVAAFALRRLRPAGDGDAAAPAWGPGVVAGFCLSAAAAGIYGAVTVGIVRAAVAADGSSVLLLLFGAVAVAGVVRGNRLVGPVAAVLGAVAVQLLMDGGTLRQWEPFDTRLLVAALLAVCLVLSHGIDRLLAPRR